MSCKPFKEAIMFCLISYRSMLMLALESIVLANSTKISLLHVPSFVLKNERDGWRKPFLSILDSSSSLSHFLVTNLSSLSSSMYSASPSNCRSIRFSTVPRKAQMYFLDSEFHVSLPKN